MPASKCDWRISGQSTPRPRPREANFWPISDKCPGSGQETTKRSDEGAKGGSLEVLVTLGTSGTIAGLVQIVKLWLSRDRRRSLKVSVRNTADGVNIELEGEEISVAALTEALSAIKLDPGGDPRHDQAGGTAGDAK